MRLILMSWMIIGLMMQVGCGKEEQPATKPSGMANKPLVEEQAIAPSVLPLTNAVHPIAGRSAFPEHDEDLQQPIPAKKLSELDPFVEAIDPDKIPEIVPWEEAKKYVGYEITVEGKIVDIGRTSDGKVNFLNFHKEWRGKFYMVIFSDLAKKLPKSVEQTFLNKTVRVKGKVEEHRGRPQIKILSMDQVKFVGE